MPQLNVAELNSDEDDKKEEDSSASDKEPCEVEGDLATPIDEGAVRAFRVLSKKLSSKKGECTPKYVSLLWMTLGSCSDLKDNREDFDPYFEKESM
jgi:hypothetical protein